LLVVTTVTFSADCPGREADWAGVGVAARGGCVAAAGVFAGGADVDGGDVGAGTAVAESPPQAAANNRITGTTRIPSSFTLFLIMFFSVLLFWL
jgi:hypothetical protein